MGARLAFVLCLLLGLGGCASTADKAVGAAGVDLKATTALAEDSYAKGDWPTAARNYAILTQRIPQDANLWFKLGNAYARSEQPDQAIVAYREVLVRDGAFAKAWFNMGIVQLRQAANSFLKMETNVPAGDPMRAQAQQAYASIMKIIGEGDPATPAGAAPARSAPAPGQASGTAH